MKYAILLLFLVACTGTYMLDDISSMAVRSPEFSNHGMIPTKYTCDGRDVNPPLIISGTPSNVVSYALEMTDFDAPSGEFSHWLVWNIPPVRRIAEGSLPVGSVQGTNDFNKIGYSGPCPPYGVHSYRFRIYALDKKLDIPTSTKDFSRAIEGHVLHIAEYWGRYGRR